MGGVPAAQGLCYGSPMRKFMIFFVMAGFLSSCVSQRLKNDAEKNPVFDLPAGSSKADELWFLSEINQGTHRKYEFRTATGELFLDRVLCPRKVAGQNRYVHNFPVSYGISPGRFNIDLDPLDLNVLGKAKEEDVGKPRRVRVIGMMKFDECDEVPCLEEKHWTQDWKVLAVEESDPAYKEVMDVSSLPASDRTAIVDFFSNYKGPKKDAKGREYPQTRVTGFLGKKETLALIQRDFPLFTPEQRREEVEACQDRYSEIAEAKPEPAGNPAYLSCLQRVRNPRALPGSPDFDFFLKYDAGMRLIELKEKDVRLSNSLARMGDRKMAGKNFYRFVSRDLPVPGTGAPVFEWVETKDRNKGCPAGWPGQHYESRPLVDR